ncbi:MAG: hypothetical protein ACRDC9_13550 [Plesiomonas shigelloides]
MKLAHGLIMLTLFLSAGANAVIVSSGNITQEDILKAQNSWGDGLLGLSSVGKSDQSTLNKMAVSFVDSVYGYSDGVVLFKPTLAKDEHTFRLSKDAAISYFIGGNEKYTQDKGFAIKEKWVSFKHENAAIQMNGQYAYAMGKLHLVNKQGVKTIVDKTWGFKKMDDGSTRVILHHSSLPYDGK